MGPNKSDTVEIIIELSLTVFMIIAEFAAIWYIHVGHGFKWSQKLIVICILTQFGNVATDLTEYFMLYTDYYRSHPQMFAWLLSLAVSIFYFCNTLVWWLYGLKQWTISIEIPRKFNIEVKDGIRVTQKCYRIMKWTGIGVNVIVVAVLAVFRYLVVISIAKNLPNVDHLEKCDFALNQLSAGLTIVAGLFLVDALRRLKKTFQTNPTY